MYLTYELLDAQGRVCGQFSVQQRAEALASAVRQHTVRYVAATTYTDDDRVVGRNAPIFERPVSECKRAALESFVIEDVCDTTSAIVAR